MILFNMHYLTISYLFLCIASGFGAIFIYFALYLKFRLNELKYYIYFLVSITIIVITITINFYYKSIFYKPRTILYDYVFFTLLLIGESLFVFSFPLFIYSLNRKFLLKTQTLALLSLSPFFLYFLLHLINFIFKVNFNILKISIYYSTVLLIITLVHLFFLNIFNRKNVDIILSRRILKIVNIFSVFYSPFAIIDAFYDEFFFIFKYLPDGFSFSAPYYFFWNVASLMLIAYFFIKFKPTLNREINDEMLMKYKITEKEKEIAQYILKGYLNKEICDKTFTSITTVKKHVYNLFQKTNAKNRVELINILSGKIKV